MPDGQNEAMSSQTVGLGLDPRTNTYKVARYFYRFVDHITGTYDAGTEVFTAGGDASGRETVEPPPYRIEVMQIAKYFEGSLFWNIRKKISTGFPNSFQLRR